MLAALVLHQKDSCGVPTAPVDTAMGHLWTLLPRAIHTCFLLTHAQSEGHHFWPCYWVVGIHLFPASCPWSQYRTITHIPSKLLLFSF